MSDTQHTPGEWTVFAPENGAIHVDAGSAGAGGICDLYHVWRDEAGEHIFTKHDAEANAHLIAAAPELLAACEQINYAKGDIAYMDFVQLRNAIKKAKGGS